MEDRDPADSQEVHLDRQGWLEVVADIVCVCVCVRACACVRWGKVKIYIHNLIHKHFHANVHKKNIGMYTCSNIAYV